MADTHLTASKLRLVANVCRVVLGVTALAYSGPIVALTCGLPSAHGVLNNPKSPNNILIGVVTETRLEKPTKLGQGRIVGQFQVLEVLRGKSRDNIRVTTSSIGTTYPGVITMGVPYLVMLSDDKNAELDFGPCQRPLILDPTDVSIGDGCRIYQFRELLNIEQPRSRVCEVVSRSSSLRSRRRTPQEYERVQEEIRRAKWEDLGVDWSRE